MNDLEFNRYQRQIMVPDIGEKGQDAICNSTVLIIGCGGLGSAVSQFLAGSGCRNIVIADGDAVDNSNLQRQTIYRESDIGENKAEATAKHLKALNSLIRVRAIKSFIKNEQLKLEVMMADIVLDCSDNFPTRQAINVACVETKTPLISGSAIGWTGQVILFDFKQKITPCYRCVVPFTEASESVSCAESGIIGPVVGIIGNLQALEAIKYLSGTTSKITKESEPTMNLFDGKNLTWQKFKIGADTACPICQGH